ncbi:acyl-CoA desaturase [Candidatus Methylacidithermus pantelleriae]|uniref:Fatty acid desaturase n=1 Tax=Candidatus Methylacidithermus pantelleriae TaxID=2744239 RepID=A0A8J2FW66_9BACT|nr:fatty acid desaturase [Candidatus Methylacidithermus pantelleriae]CAF0697509.1 Fatty acid desaturase [Candidatus Methylacidithermus pantelleriae]
MSQTNTTGKRKIHWLNFFFLTGTLVAAAVGVPLYLWVFGWDWYQFALFVLFFILTGLSITLGYHRLYSHHAFEAAWPIKLFTILFGAATFQGTVIEWASDHRYHHKFVDRDGDPYDVTKGFFHAHIGWLLYGENRNNADNVRDLLADPFASWQKRYYVPLAVGMGIVLPTLLGFLYKGPVGALGGFLIPGIARIVFVQHMTFFINSLCHMVGRRPYSIHCTCRDSWVLALVTFGEGYHNFHHAFAYDYRNGVLPWQWDPTKWAIWILHRLGLVWNLKKARPEAILLARLHVLGETLQAKLAQWRQKAARLPVSFQNGLFQVESTLARWKDYWSNPEKRKELSEEILKTAVRELERADAFLRRLDRVRWASTG